MSEPQRPVAYSTKLSPETIRLIRYMATATQSTQRAVIERAIHMYYEMHRDRIRTIMTSSEAWSL